MFAGLYNSAMANAITHHVTLDGKTYRVVKRPEMKMADGSTFPASVSIYVSWETVRPGDQWSVHPQKIHRTASISPTGRIGRRVLAQIKD